MATSQLRLRLAHRDGATRIIEQYQTAPLKVARALPSVIAGQPAAEICVMDASPGLLGGDEYRLEFEAGAKTSTRIVSQGFTRVHPGESSLDVRINVESGARLFYLPEAAVLFHEAKFQNSLVGKVEKGGFFVGLELLAAGRLARGEAFEFDSYRGRLHLKHAENWTLCAQTGMLPGETNLTGPFAWGEFTHWGTLFGVADGLAARWVELAHEVISTTQLPNLQAAVSLLPHDGVAVALLSRRAQEARTLALEIVARWESTLVEP